MNRKWFLLAAVGVMLVLSVVGCALGPGNLPGQNVQAPPNSGNPPASGQNGIPGGRGGPGVQGTVTSVSGSVIQLSAQDGSTLTVQLVDSTVIQKTESASLADIQANTQITVLGDTNGNTVTARLVEIGSVGD